MPAWEFVDLYISALPQTMAISMQFSAKSKICFFFESSSCQRFIVCLFAGEFFQENLTLLNVLHILAP